MEVSDKALWATMTGSSLVGASGFANPWTDNSIRYAPRTMRDAFTLSEFLYLNYGVYRKASEKIVDYFLTKPNFKGQDDEERKKFERIMNQDFGVIQRLQEAGYDRMCYGNSILSMHFPFRRMLRCAKCKNTERHIQDVDYQFSSADFSFHARCPQCKTITKHMVQNYRKANAKKIRLVRWDPKRIIIEHNPMTGDSRYWLDIPAQIQSLVRRGDKFILSTLPWGMIMAIKNNQKYLFKEDAVLHLKESNLAGVNLGGWGIPSVLSAFKNFFRLQILLRYDETLMMDYIVPLRIMSPAELRMPAGNDFVTVNVQNFIEQAGQAVRRHRIDGCDWAFFPFGVNYQAVGGEGQTLSQATKDIIAQEEDRLLQVRGLPTDIYRGTLTTQVAPVGLRLFARGNTGLLNDFNMALNWMSSAIARYLDHGETDAELEEVSIVDNIEQQQMKMQLAMAGRLSMQTGIGIPMNIDMKEENKRLTQEMLDQQKQQQEAQQDMQMASMSLDAQTGEAAGQQQQGGMTPMDVEAQGDEMARQLADPSMPESNRRQQLSALRNTNPTLHAVVIKRLEQIRNQAGTAGREAGLAAMGIGKTAGFQKMASHTQILWMADAFFPTKEGEFEHTLSWNRHLEKDVLTVTFKGARYAIAMDLDEMAREPMEIVANVADIVVQKAA